MKNIYLLQKLLKHTSLIILLMVIALVSESQNIAITDSAEYNAEVSAMLDVMSTDKGMLVPRMTTSQRLLIASPAIGLLVYDTNNSGFYYFDGSGWLAISESTSGTGSALFAVLNATGDTVFAVYDDGAKVIVPFGAKGKVGGFAVSGRTSSKELFEDNYLVITPDSARIYINDTVSAKGKVGGFAVSGRTSAKGVSTDIIFATVDSTRIYVDETDSKGKVGGFAVSGRTSAKATSTSSFINFSSKNYFIGRNSGVNNAIGEYNFFAGDSSGYSNISGSKNIFLGYSSGYSNVGEGLDFGNQNIFIGYKAGYKNQIGFNNIFLGYQAGYNNLGGGGFEEGSFNTFIGYESGFENQVGGSNTFLGYQSGQKNYNGNHNTYLGRWAGAENTDGSYNVFVGTEAGRYENRSYKLCINAVNQPHYIAPLIFGDFQLRQVVIDGDDSLLYSAPGDQFKFYVNGKAGGFSAWSVYDQGKSKNTKSSNLVGSLDKVLNLQGISYSKSLEKGIIQNEIAIEPQSASKIIPDIVKSNGEFYSIQYGKLTVLLIEAIKEQQTQIDELQKLIKIKNIELEESDNTNDKINLLIEENKKLKQDIAEIKELLK